MRTIEIPALSLARLRTQFGAFQQTAQTIVEAMGYAETPGANLNLEAGVLEIPEVADEAQRNGEVHQPLGAV
jgi:hypothetical protein